MEIDHEKGTLLWYWYEDWIVVGGFAAALVIAAWVTIRNGWSAGGLLMKTLMAAAAVLAALPLTLVRLAVDIDVFGRLGTGLSQPGGSYRLPRNRVALPGHLQAAQGRNVGGESSIALQNSGRDLPALQW
jgi:hypothetical protein